MASIIERIDLGCASNPMRVLICLTTPSVIIYSSEADAKEENARRQAMRKDTIAETGHLMVEETMGPVLSIVSQV